MKRAISGEEEDLRWDFDDEDDEEGGGSKSRSENSDLLEKEQAGSSNSIALDNEKKGLNGDLAIVSEPNHEKIEARTEDSDISVVSTQPSIPDEGWDEIEDIVVNDESKGQSVSTTCGDNLQKQLTATSVVVDEDLRWDVEEDDEPLKES